mmetsp:Transcript_3126/g.7276  ORF Transcript_3126/g.7276 Transcript_3126/m.7276 type:complete len:246 (-) Transcript_3126:122-859(-)
MKVCRTVCLLLALLLCAGGTSIVARDLRSDAWNQRSDVWQTVRQMMSWLFPSSLSDSSASPKVVVEFFVMSKCPDAELCEETFLPVLRDLAGLVEVKFTYIGTVKGTDVECMHGPPECAGDRQRLCVQETATVPELLSFALCQDKDRAKIPQNGEACATTAGLDTAEVTACWSGTSGDELLKASVKHAAAESIQTSCTVQIQSKDFCVHDGVWRDCGSCGSDKAACLKTKVCGLSKDPRKSEFCD